MKGRVTGRSDAEPVGEYLESQEEHQGAIGFREEHQTFREDYGLGYEEGHLWD